MPVFNILYLLFAHWFADFVMQRDKDARKKSKKWKNLLNHTFEYSLIMSAFIFFYHPEILALFIFFSSTFISHTTIDYYTSRINTKLLAQNKRHKFFVSIGFDQWIHYAILFLTINYLFH